MLQVIVSNIPENFTSQDLFLLLQQSNIQCSEELFEIQQSKHHKSDGYSTGRYVILDYDDKDIARIAVDTLNRMVLTINSNEISLRAAPYIINFPSYLENHAANLIVYNIPYEISVFDFVDLFSQFGPIIYAIIKKPIFRTNEKVHDLPIGYIFFETKEQADNAMESADGKYLGPNKLCIVKMKKQLQE
ncbi:Polyadenylate-binding_protein [Hexamita inflata]|uniref:Polyadenylate-binding protein n=1 Tax=Hexamita inflata TaxID=28002 RepID=A0AA86PZK1_9EUKA|nr:Polyadenylate-binding protein [Hexamita inflata]